MAERRITRKIHRDSEGLIVSIEEIGPAEEPVADPRIDVLLSEVEHLKRADEDRRREIRRLEDERNELAARVEYYEEREERRTALVLDQRERALALHEEGREPSPAEREVLALSEQLDVLDLHERQKHVTRTGAIELSVNDRGVYSTPARSGK